MELLIVDDERSAIEAVKKGICWERLSFTQIFTAANIVDAKKVIETHHIRVLLCDIEMPMGTGLELLEWINEKRLDICCIFMTCHAEFSFAQQALHLGSFEYVLKPLDFKKVQGILAEAIRRESREKKVDDKYLEKSKKAMRQQFWRSFFIGDIAYSEEGIRSYILNNQLNIPMDAGFLPILVSPYGFPKNMHTDERKLYGFALRNVIGEIFVELDGKYDLETLSDDKVLIVAIVDKKIEERGVHGKIGVLCGKLLRTVEKYFHLQICCYVGDRGKISEVPSQLEDLLAMDLNNIINQRMVLFRNVGQAIFTDEYEKASCFLELYAKYSDNYKKVLEGMVIILKGKAELIADGQFMYQFFVVSYFILNEFSKKNHVILIKLIDEEKNNNLLKKALSSMDGLVEWIKYIKDTIVHYENKSRTGKTLSDEVAGYINTHLDLELSAEKVAQQVNLNVDYLNRVFKRESNISLNRYIVQQKMEQAKWLLKHTDWQIGEVAAAVGYYNYSSFYRCFHKQVGKSPQEYKEVGK